MSLHSAPARCLALGLTLYCRQPGVLSRSSPSTGYGLETKIYLKIDTLQSLFYQTAIFVQDNREYNVSSRDATENRQQCSSLLQAEKSCAVPEGMR